MKKVICLLVAFILISLGAVPANADVGSDKGTQSMYVHDPVLGSETGRTTDGFDMVVYNNVAYYINHSIKGAGHIYSIKMGPNGEINIAKSKPIGSDEYCSNLNLLNGCLYYASIDGIQKYDIIHNKLTFLYKCKGVRETVATKYGIIFTRLGNDSELYGIWSIDTAGKNLKQLSKAGDIKNLQYYNKCIYYIYKPNTKNLGEFGQLRSFNLETKKEQLVIPDVKDIKDYHIYNNVAYITGWLKTKDGYYGVLEYSVDLANISNREIFDFIGQLFMIGDKAYIYTLGSTDKGYISWVDIRALDMKTASYKRIYEDKGVDSRLGCTYQTSSGKKMAYVFEYNPNPNSSALINIRNVDLETLK